MQTWWDPQSQAWYTRDANGTIRRASQGEVLLAIGNGYNGAPAGAPSPGATSPTPNLNPNPDQPAPTAAPSTASSIPAPAAAPPAPAPAPAQPAPQMDWKAGATWGNFNQMQKDYFNDPGNANDAEDLYFRNIGLTGNALQYAKSQSASIRAKFANDSFASAGTPGGKAPLFTDWLQQGGSQNLINGYNMLSARARGGSLNNFGTGRMMF